MEIFKRVPKFDFMKKKTMAVALSSIVILIGIISVLIHGGLRYGIDFAGGTLVQLKFINPPVIEDVREGLKTIGLGESTIQEFGSGNHILIRVERSEEKLEEMGTRIKNSLVEKFNVNKIIVERNFGDGMFTQLLKPVVNKYYPVSIEEVNHSKQKELRIIDTL